jgi:O-antigen ligase
VTGKVSFSRLAGLGPHGIFLALAVAAGGLRSQSSWLVFGALFLGWSARSARGFGAGGPPAAAIFFSWLAAAAVFSPDPAASAGVFSGYAVLGLAFFSAAACKEGRQDWLAAVGAVGAAAAVVLLVQKISGQSVTGLIGGNPNYSAVFCAAAFSAALLSAVTTAGKKEKTLNYALALLLAAGLLASGSRGALLSAFLAAATGLYVSGRRRALAALILAGAAGLALLPPAYLEGFLKFSDPRAFARPRLWGAALEAAAARPLLGWGPGLFGRAFEIFKFPWFDGVSYFGHSTPHAHSEILNLAAEAGFPAAIFFLLSAAGGLLSGGPKNLPVKLCALAALIQGGTDMIFYSGAVGLLFWGSLGFACADGGPAFVGSKKLRAAVAALLLAGLAMGPAAGLFSGRGDFLARSYGEARRGRNQALELALLRSSALDKPKDPFIAAAAGRALAAAGDNEGALAGFKAALALEPFCAGARIGLAGALAAGGRLGECAAELRVLEAMPPAPARNAYQRALLSYDREDFEKLKKELCVKNKTGGATAPSRKTR